MNLIWHIIRKDIRRLWLPLALWLVLLLAHTALLAVPVGPNATTASYEGLYYFANTWGVIVAAVGFILAAWLVMEDSLVDTQAFWTTRPISGARLLAAKALGAFLLLSLLPALVLTPVWLACGFSFREWIAAAYELAIGQAVLSVAAFALAGVTATSGQFLVRAIGGAVLLPVYAGFVLGRIAGADRASAGLTDSRFWLVMGLLAITPLAGTIHQFLTRRTGRTAVIFGLGLLLMLGVRYGWVWDFDPVILKFAQRNVAVNAPGDQWVRFRAEFGPGGVRQPPSGMWLVKMECSPAGRPPGAYVRLDRIGGTWVKATERIPTRFEFEQMQRPPVQTARQVAGLSGAAGEPVSFAFSNHTINPADARGCREHMTLEAEVLATVMQGRLLGELPLRVGAELQVGASGTRIASIERVDGLVHIRLEERDAWPTTIGGMYSNDGAPSRSRVRPAEDCFILLNRSLGTDQFLPAGEIGTVRINSLMTGQRELVLTPPTRVVGGHTVEVDGWEEANVLLKVRFLRDHTLARSLTVDPSAAQP